MNRQEIENRIIPVLQSHGVKSIAIFGSYARGENRPDSDLDVLVEFSSQKTLFDLIGIEQELSEMLGIKVDMLTENAISPYLINSIKQELVLIYG